MPACVGKARSSLKDAGEDHNKTDFCVVCVFWDIFVLGGPSEASVSTGVP